MAAAPRLRVRIREGTEPPYVQLRDGVRARIERGGLLPGDRLPTVRACAEELGLAPNTVARAYRELEDDAWLVGRGRAGTFVADVLPARPSDAESELAVAADAYLRRTRQLGFDDGAARDAVGTSITAKKSSTAIPIATPTPSKPGDQARLATRAGPMAR